MENLVVYKGIPCKLLAAEKPFPSRLQIISPNDISKAMQIGFSCWGYPNEIMKNEIMKEVTPEELECLQHFGRFPLN
ncbi:2-oxoglutarate:acceptor oxidoreductase [Streptococcus infantis]|uniref:2-oxoglutarate:acceptor oxidoreductase n=1 Tax=Streptococcus infantis TaxID=68892 RepID=UPI0039C46BF3